MKKPVALASVTAGFFILSVLYCGEILVPDLLAYGHIKDWVMDPIIAVCLVCVGFGLWNLNKAARNWAMFFFAVNILFSGLSAYERVSGAMAGMELFFIKIPDNISAVIDLFVCVVSVWSFFILTRPNMRRMFSSKFDTGVR